MALAVEMAPQAPPQRSGEGAAGLRGAETPEGRTGSEGWGCVALTADQCMLWGNPDSLLVVGAVE